MGSMSIWHWVIVALVIMLLFGKGRISDMMGDMAKGIKSFKQGMADDPTTTTYTPPQPPQPPLQVAQAPLQPMAPPVAQPAPVLSPDPSPAGAPPPQDSLRP